MPQRFNSQRGALPILMLVAAVGMVSFLLISNTFDFKDKLFSSLFPKPASEATEALTEEEKKIAGINENGQLTTEKAAFLAKVAPESYQQLVEIGLVAEPAAVAASLQVQGGGSEPSVSPTSVLIPLSPSMSSCGEITSAGNYSLANDVAREHEACIRIHDTQNVNLDCQNHSIVSTFNLSENLFIFGALRIENIQNFSVKNCNIQSIYPSGSNSQLGSFYISNSSFGDIQKITVSGGYMQTRNSNNLQISDNIINTFYQQYNSSYVQIYNNQFKIDSGIPAAGVINLGGGYNNIIQNNTIDGQWDGVDHTQWQDNKGADDGIIISGETNDKIFGNSISNNWDCGIETLGFIQNTQISNNRINNSGLCGIGGWYFNSWLGNTVDSNVVDGSAYMFYMFRVWGLDQAHNEQTVYFKDNKFTNNTFQNQRSTSIIGPTGLYSSSINFQNLPSDLPSSALQLGNNIFKDNDFSLGLPGPILIPASMIINGGGNQCGLIDSTSQNLNSALICTVNCIRANPTVSITPSGQWGIPGQSLRYAIQLNNNDLNCSPSTFLVTPTVPAGFSYSDNNLNFIDLPAGVGTSKFIDITSSLNATDGFYPISISAYNDSASSYTSSATANYNINTSQPDPPPPTPTPQPGQCPGGSLPSYNVLIGCTSGGCTFGSQNPANSCSNYLNGPCSIICAGSGTVTSCTYDLNNPICPAPTEPPPPPTPTPTPIPPSPTPIPPTSTPTPIPPTPTPAPCSVTSASWNSLSNPVTEGSSVSLSATTSGNCSGKQVSFEVKENDTGFGELEADGLLDDNAQTQPLNVTITNNAASTTWIAEFVADGLFGTAYPPEYHFNATVVGEGTPAVRSADPLLLVTPASTPPTLAPITLAGSNQSTSGTWSQTCGTGTNRMLIVTTSEWRGDASSQVSGITYAGAPLTKLGQAYNTATGALATMWYRVGPASGSNNITATYTTQVAFGSSCWSNVLQVAPSSFSSIFGSSTAPSITVNNNVSGDVVVDGVSVLCSQTLTVSAPQTQYANIPLCNAKLGSSSKAATSSSTTMSWTKDGGEGRWAMVAASLKQAALSSPTPTPTPTSVPTPTPLPTATPTPIPPTPLPTSGQATPTPTPTPIPGDTQPPSTPLLLTATAVSSTQVNLSWNPSSDNVGVKSYQIYRNNTLIASNILTTSFGDSGLTAQTAYSYFVKALDAAGNTSVSSNTASTTTLAPPVSGNITGTVSSSAGGVVSGAKLTLIVNGSKKTYTTSSSGVYTVSSIPNGTYTMKFQAQGFVSQDVPVTVSGNTVTKNVTLVTR